MCIIDIPPGQAVSADVHSLKTRHKIGKAKGLLQSLVPRAQCFCFYDTARACIWSSDGADDYETDDFVAELPAEFLAAATKIPSMYAGL